MSIRMKRSGLGLFLLAVLFVALTWSVPAHAETIKEKIVSSQGTGGVSGLEKQVDDSTQNVVSTARKIFVSLTIVFGIWLGICYFRAGFSPDSLRETKGRIMFFVLFLILSFWTESILGAIFNFLGIDLSKL
ncbi:hypothetical protein KIH86_08510 [Paenibacillus sp. HN-1]|uniref:hypothetical protein n=1 Tax=Paenibacillus TaxID=44249 RepID=UPI001CAA0064|nr:MULTISPECIES: hypothetical protein [Paenibacillus]MBY9079592.1 hypothetical protein [Paenibacillus sp. CGMCC 1.18879]MBY9084281.1 hypothetical protein [Paenibacillus sinensis]